MKKRKDIHDKSEELFDRVWLMRHHMDMINVTRQRNEDISKGALAAAEKVRAKYPKERLAKDLLYAGHLEGWMAAIRWVLDDEATEETDWLYDS